MRYILETIFLALFMKIDNETQVFEDKQAMEFTYQDKNYILTIEERERKNENTKNLEKV